MSTFADTESLCLISFKLLTFRRRFGAPFSGHLMTALDRIAYPHLGERLTREEGVIVNPQRPPICNIGRDIPRRHGGGVDDVVGTAGAQQVQEVLSRLFDGPVAN
jgi:hypothetical protein